MNSLKQAVIYGSTGYLYKFYWASWSPNVCVAKEHAATRQVAWNIVQSLKAARDMWARLCTDESCALGANQVVTNKDAIWDSERIQWVRRTLAE